MFGILKDRIKSFAESVSGKVKSKAIEESELGRKVKEEVSASDAGDKENLVVRIFDRLAEKVGLKEKRETEAGHPEPAKQEPSESEFHEPEISKIETLEPETSKIEIPAPEEQEIQEPSEPEILEPETLKPETSKQEIPEPEFQKPELPKLSEPSKSELPEPEPSGPEIQEQEHREPEIIEPSKPEIQEQEPSKQEFQEQEPSEPEHLEPEIPEVKPSKIVIPESEPSKLEIPETESKPSKTEIQESEKETKKEARDIVEEAKEKKVGLLRGMLAKVGLFGKPSPEPGTKAEEKVEEKKEEKAEEEKKAEKKEKEVIEREVAEIQEKLEEEQETAKAQSKVKEEKKQGKSQLGMLTKLKGLVFGKVSLSEADVERVLEDLRLGLLESDVAFEVADNIVTELKEKMTGNAFSYHEVEKEIKDTVKDALVHVLTSPEKLDVLGEIKKRKASGEPTVILFVGVNGVGKTLHIAKFAKWLMDNGCSVVMAAGDTFRMAAIEQLEIHAERLGVKVVKHNYGSDSAAVIFDAKKHAKANNIDVVLADTAGRAHTNVNLMDELKKVTRVNNPDICLLVVEALAGNDLCNQARQFNEAVNIDGVILTKIDADAKGGGAVSITRAINKPILFFGVGQGYGDLQKFDPESFAAALVAS